MAELPEHIKALQKRVEIAQRKVANENMKLLREAGNLSRALYKEGIIEEPVKQRKKRAPAASEGDAAPAAAAVAEPPKKKGKKAAKKDKEQK
ncbi:MAG: hypothetical protein K2Q45_06655 [Nitrosomonas sp.]|nr:hypothetical protein [Nitrosomonas sp.]